MLWIVSIQQHYCQYIMCCTFVVLSYSVELCLSNCSTAAAVTAAAHHGLILMLMKCRYRTIILLCLVVSVETGEKAEKESQRKEEEEPQAPKKSAIKKEKPKTEGGFQIWTELETQRNKFMVTHLLVFVSERICHSSLIHQFTDQLKKYSSLFGRTTSPETSTTCVSWLCSSRLP